MAVEAHHGTQTLSRLIMAKPIEVFPILTQIRNRIVWSGPREAQYRFSDADFRVGGMESFQCDGPRNELLSGQVSYLIIDSPHRLVFLEQLALNNFPLAVSLQTMELFPAGVGTDVRWMIQALSLAGPDLVTGFRPAAESVLTAVEQVFAG